LLYANIVGRELTENTNASGEPKCSMKEEILLTDAYNKDIKEEKLLSL